VLGVFGVGFRLNHSIVQQLFRITEHISTSFEKHCHTGAVFMDISKAFDKVWHTGLMYKLNSLNTQKYLFYIIKYFLSNRQFSVKINDNLFDLQPTIASVPQGSKLAPILFNIYISNIPQSPHTNIVLFADYTTIYSKSRNIGALFHNLQNHLNVLSAWCKNWKI
jgi:retron-type reverse transcriptase